MIESSVSSEAHSIDTYGNGNGNGIGYGKTILFGEHFVVYGLPAIAAALTDYTKATVEIGTEGLTFIDNRPETPGYKETKRDEIQRQLNALLKHFKIDTKINPIKITLSGNLVCASGIGASAALAASISRALNQLLDLNMTDEQINGAAYIAEEAGSGTPSGIDNTCAVFGGLITFEKNLHGGLNKIERMKIKQSVEIVLANSGITQETKIVVKDVKILKDKNPEMVEKVFENYKNVFHSALPALENGNWKILGELMNKNHELLQEITVSCKELDKMQKIALEANAFGAKLTGTGRGGLMLILTPGEELQQNVANSLENVGFNCKKTKIGGD
ncbi:MAG: mevalonate kinase [Nanoarchaeota archaeon]|nr:mevalonate kinase [Nanoarchaeota archaeon]MBU4124386.1 mevalonate kinase [Nanoarchaeota archaeon]